MPNPNDGNLQLLQTVADAEPVSIKVYNVIGALVYATSKSFNANAVNLRLTSLSPGHYHVVLRDGKGVTYTLRFVKK